MAAIKTLVVDDEVEARRGLYELLEKEPDVELAGACADGHEAVAAIEEHQPELVFLDVQMPGLSGFDVLRTVEMEPLPVVIFVTAYDQYALHAFDVHAVDYLLKPFSERRLHEALERARKHIQGRKMEELSRKVTALMERLEEAELEPEEASEPYLQRVALKKGARVAFVDVQSIDWIEAADNYVRLHVGQRTHLLRATLNYMEERLDPRRFLRVHRSRIVNISRIREVRPLGSGDALLVLQNGTELISSRTYGEQRRQALQLSR